MIITLFWKKIIRSLTLLCTCNSVGTNKQALISLPNSSGVNTAVMKCAAFGLLQLLLCFPAAYAQENCSEHTYPFTSVGADYVEICCSDQVWIGELRLSQDTHKRFVIDNLKKVNGTSVSGSDKVVIPLIFDKETNTGYQASHYYVVCSRLTVDPNCPLRCIIVRPCGCSCSNNNWLTISVQEELPRHGDAEIAVRFDFSDLVVPLNMSYSYYFWRDYLQCKKPLFTWVEDSDLKKQHSIEKEVVMIVGGDNNSCKPLVHASVPLQSDLIRDQIRHRIDPTITANFNQNGTKLTELYFTDRLWVNTTFIAQRLEDMLQHSVSLPSYIVGTTAARKVAVRNPVTKETHVSNQIRYYYFPFPIDMNGDFNQNVIGLCMSHSKQESANSANLNHFHGIIWFSSILTVFTAYFH